MRLLLVGANGVRIWEQELPLLIAVDVTQSETIEELRNSVVVALRYAAIRTEGQSDPEIR